MSAELFAPKGPQALGISPTLRYSSITMHWLPETRPPERIFVADGSNSQNGVTGSCGSNQRGFARTVGRPPRGNQSGPERRPASHSPAMAGSQASRDTATPLIIAGIMSVFDVSATGETSESVAGSWGNRPNDCQALQPFSTNASIGLPPVLSHHTSTALRISASRWACSGRAARLIRSLGSARRSYRSSAPFRRAG